MPTPPLAKEAAQSELSRLLGHLPPWLDAFVVATLTWALLPQQVFGGLRWTIEWLRKRRPKGDKRRAAQRARFASMIATQVSQISDAEDWRDEQFAELDAEVEMRARQHQGVLRRRRRLETFRRVPSLTVALERNSDPIILLEGEPGSGKSVALRHLALRMCAEMKSHPSERGVIPLYLNLKEFRPSGSVNANAVLDFVMSSLKRRSVVYVERFLEQEFDRGIEEGTWLFLFDSFDEIPAVLGTVEADDVIAEYAAALDDFLTGMNACRGVIASRDFRGPKTINWPRFRVLRLTGKQRRDLIQKLDLPADTEQRMLSGLVTADMGVRQLADNPLFLALLCEYQRDMTEFPQSSHVVFENYVAKRFQDDGNRLVGRFGLTSDAVRTIAEQSAYCMSAEPGLGLSPRREALLNAMRQAGFSVGTRSEAALDALVYLRLARPAESQDGVTDGFTFAHRRFQEYFATCLVMRESARADPFSLLTSGRWRETAVTLFQTQSEAAIQPLVAQAIKLLRQMTMGTGQSDDAAAVFAWPPGSLHLLSLVQDGLPSGDRRRSPELGELAGRLLEKAYAKGQLHDRRWAIESCLAADTETAWDIIRGAFASKSGWLREAAFSQAGRLEPMPIDVREQVRGVLAQLAGGGRLREHWLEIDAQLRRLPDPRPELLLARLFLVSPVVSAILLGAATLTATLEGGLGWRVVAELTGMALVLLSFQSVDRDIRRLDRKTARSWIYAWFYFIAEVLYDPDAGEELGSGAIIYLYIALTFAWVTNGINFNGPGTWLTGGFVVYLIMWGPAANRADRLLRNPRLYKIAALPLLWLLQTCASAARWLWRSVRTHRIIYVLSFSAAATLLVITVRAAIVSAHMRGEMKSTANGGIVILIASYLILAMIGVPFLIVRNLRKRKRDSHRLRNVERGTTSFADFAALLELLDSFETQRALLLFVEDVWRRHVYLEHSAALRALQVFAHISEVWSAKEKPEPVVPGVRLEPSEVQALTHWMEIRWTAKKRRKRDFAIGQTAIDQIAKMVADAEFARQSSTASISLP